MILLFATVWKVSLFEDPLFRISPHSDSSVFSRMRETPGRDSFQAVSITKKYSVNQMENRNICNFIADISNRPEVFLWVRCSWKFCNIHSKNTSNRVSFLNKASLYWKRDSGIGVFQRILKNFQRHLFLQSTSGGCSCAYSFHILGVLKFDWTGEMHWMLAIYLFFLCKENRSLILLDKYINTASREKYKSVVPFIANH